MDLAPLCSRHLRKHALMLSQGSKGPHLRTPRADCIIEVIHWLEGKSFLAAKQFPFLSDCPCPRCSCPPSSKLPSCLFLSPFSGSWPSRKEEEEEAAATTTITEAGLVPKLPSVSEGIRRMEGRKPLFGRWTAIVLAIQVKAAIHFTTGPCLFEGRFDCSNV